MSNINFFRMMAGNGANRNADTIPCNYSGISFSGNAGIYNAQAVVLGKGIGPITASFNAIGVPDRFELLWSSSRQSSVDNPTNVAADSLFVGDNLKTTSGYNTAKSAIVNVTSLSTYDYNFAVDSFGTATGTENVNFTSASLPPQSADGGAFLRNNSSSLVTGNSLSNVSGKGNWGAQKGVLNDWPNPQSSPSVTSASCVDGSIQICFFKDTETPTTFDLKITGVGGTAWSLTEITCPTGTEVNSSSIMDSVGRETTVYHTAPSFDLKAGMQMYWDENLEYEFENNSLSGVPNTGSYWGSGSAFDPPCIVSGTLMTNPSTYGPWNSQCYKNSQPGNSGFSFFNFVSDQGIVDGLFCSSSLGRPNSRTMFSATA